MCLSLNLRKLHPEPGVHVPISFTLVQLIKGSHSSSVMLVCLQDHQVANLFDCFLAQVYSLLVFKS